MDTLIIYEKEEDNMSSKEIDTMIPMNYSSFLILLSLKEKSYGYKI